MGLLEAWANFNPEAPPFVLDADRDLLTSKRSIANTIVFRSWHEALRAPDFCAPGDTKLHLGLLPMPVIGDVREAIVYILLLNPGLGPTDYYGEYEVRDYRKSVLDTIKQSFPPARSRFLFLDPSFAWHAGFGWWHKKLAAVILDLASVWHIPFADARRRVAESLASIELFPYHSAAFRQSGGLLNALPSVAMARDFVSANVLSRVRSGEAVAIVTRQVAQWSLPDIPGVVTYSPVQARGAYLTPSSPGGRAIIAHLRERWS